MIAAEAPVAASDPRVRDALRKAMTRCRVLRIVTVSASGRPQIMPLWFVVIDGRIYMSNAATSPTVHNIAAHPEVLVLLEGDGGELVRLRGTAQYLQDAAIKRRVTRASLPKYVLRPRALWFWVRNLPRSSARSQYVRERTDTGVIEVTPESFAIR